MIDEIFKLFDILSDGLSKPSKIQFNARVKIFDYDDKELDNFPCLRIIADRSSDIVKLSFFWEDINDVEIIHLGFNKGFSYRNNILRGIYSFSGKYAVDYKFFKNDLIFSTAESSNNLKIVLSNYNNIKPF